MSTALIVSAVVVVLFLLMIAIDAWLDAARAPKDVLCACGHGSDLHHDPAAPEWPCLACACGDWDPQEVSE